jgi:hypothetical protein
VAEDARELAGRLGVVAASGGEISIGLGGCRDARLLLMPLVVLLWTAGGAEDWEARGGLEEDRRCATAGPGEARRSRKERRGPLLEYGFSGIGDAEPARERGLLSVGNLDAVEGVMAEAERIGVGVVLA